MLQILLRAGAVVASAVLVKTLLEKNDYSEDSDCHDFFLTYEQNISVSNSKIKKLITSRKALETCIQQYFKRHHNLETPKFFIQGSYKMATMILDRNGTYDVDLGVYFLNKPNIEPMTLQKHVYTAVKNHTSSGTQHRDKCLRVIYQSDFHIDLPIYYKTKYDKHPYLATKKGWTKSDPKELCDWFKENKQTNSQLKRVIKYLKAWAQNTRGKMPSGIAFTVWATNNFKQNERDDIAFYETAKAIESSLIWNVKCNNPATPNDDFLRKLTSSQKSNFTQNLNVLIQKAYTALTEKDIIAACNTWRTVLGNKFPALL